MIDFEYQQLFGKNAIAHYQVREQASLAAKGERLAKMLGLDLRQDKYHTAWGYKTPEGLYLTVLGMIHEIESTT